MFQIILSAPKTVETGGAIYRQRGYTYFCAEEPASSGPAAERTLIVEPGVAAVVRECIADVFIACERGEAVKIHNIGSILL